MKNLIPLNPKKLTLTLRAEKWVNNGYCLAHLDEETYFISGTIPGEVVECEPISITKKFKQVVQDRMKLRERYLQRMAAQFPEPLDAFVEEGRV